MAIKVICAEPDDIDKRIERAKKDVNLGRYTIGEIKQWHYNDSIEVRREFTPLKLKITYCEDCNVQILVPRITPARLCLKCQERKAYTKQKGIIGHARKA